MPQQRRPHYHASRVNEDIARELMYILKNVKDPRVSQNFVSVTKTETTPDLKYCKIYYSNMSGIDKEVKAGLYSAMGYIRRELANRLSLRNTPELTFIRDTGAEHGARISELLREIDAGQVHSPTAENPENAENADTAQKDE